VFTTAYDQYALKAFEVNSIDYLLKPVEPGQLERALAKQDRLYSGDGANWMESPEFRAVLRELSRSVRDPPAAYATRIPVRIGERTQFLELAAITHFFAQDRLTYAATEARNYCIELSMAELEPKLDPARFFRIDRGILLNLAWIEELAPLFAGRMLVKLRDRKRTELTVARDRVRGLKERMSL
jgi:two-component system LytT family response regulator